MGHPVFSIQKITDMLSSNHNLSFNTKLMTVLKVQMKCFFISEFERAAKIRKIAVDRFLISLLVTELKRFKDEHFRQLFRALFDLKMLIFKPL